MKRSNDNNNGRRDSRLWLLFPMLLMAVIITVTAQSQFPSATGHRRDNSPIRPTVPAANRNQPGKVFLERADLLKKSADNNYQVVVGNVEFRRGGMMMYCDSAHFYDNPNGIEAFGNVRMEQGDTLFVYADWMDYSDSTQVAHLYADPGRKVRLINKDVELTTDIFNYDLGIDLGFYEVGGVVTDPRNRLVSVYGEYSPSTKEALFIDDVVLHSLRDGDTLDIYSDRILYSTETHIANLESPSTVISKDGTIYTSLGVYDTDNQISELYERSKVVAKNGNTLIGDTLYYDQQNGFGEAFGNIEMEDTTKKVRLYGDYGFYYEEVDSARVYGHALAKEYSQKDTLYLHGDTITTFRRIFFPAKPEPPAAPVAPLAAAVEADSIIADSIATDSITADSIAVSPILTDSIVADTVVAEMVTVDSIPADNIESETVVTDTIVAEVPDVAPLMADSLVLAAPPELPIEELPDTVHYLVAAPNVKFYRVDLQGLCDSMTFVSKDSLLHLDNHPVVWNENKQIFGNKIIVHLNDSTVDWAKLPDFGFVAEHIDEEFYNQLTGKEMFATFEEGQLRHLDVSGNVQAIMLPMENDSTYNKIANIESSYLSADFRDQAIERMKLWPETSGTMTPLYLAKKQLYYLQAFRWFEPLRPLKPEDVFDITDDMRALFLEPPFGTSRRR